MIQLPVSEAAVLESLSDDLAAVGFDLSPLGGGSYAINGIPSGIEGLNPVELVRNMVHTAMEKGSDVKEEVRTILALTLARAAAIVYGQVLSNDEMSNLVDSLFCLFYRPTIRLMVVRCFPLSGKRILKKLFQK